MSPPHNTKRSLVVSIPKPELGNEKKALANGNPYENISVVLTRLGMQVSHAADYQQQFGINLAKRAPAPITISPVAHLLADTTASSLAVAEDNSSTQIIQTIDTGLLSAELLALVEQARTDLNLTMEETVMWIADATTMPETNPIVIVAEANTQAHQNTQHTIGVCITADNIGNGITTVFPNSDAGYVSEFYGQNFSGAGGKVEVIQQPQKGMLQPSPYNSEQMTNYQYTPNPALAKARDRDRDRDKDYFVIMVKNQGVTVTIRYYVEVSILEPNEPRDEDQCPVRSWKISIAPNATSTAPAYSLSLPAAFLGADYASPDVTFANLTGAAVGETQGSGTNATITLDTNAAGHGWYIDYTPYLNG